MKCIKMLVSIGAIIVFLLATALPMQALTMSEFDQKIASAKSQYPEGSIRYA